MAKKLASTLKPGDVIALFGQLGAGKTTFVQALAKALGVAQTITSPSFVYLKTYPLPKPMAELVHVDLYRLASVDDIGSTHLFDYLSPRYITVVEWPERIQSILPPHTQAIYFDHGQTSTTRIIRIKKLAAPN